MPHFLSLDKLHSFQIEGKEEVKSTGDDESAQHSKARGHELGA